QQVRFAHAFPGSAADHHLPTTILADQADVFNGRLRAIAGASDYTHLEFVRSKEIFETAFQFDAGAGRILYAEAAEIRSHAGFHHANALGIGLPGRHPEIGPDSWQIGFLHAQQVDT